MPFVNLNDIDSKKLINGAEAKFVHGEGMTFATWKFTAGTALPEHSHPHEQMTRLVSGQFELTIDGESKLLTENDIAVIPSGAVHSGKAVTDCLVLDVFNPVREDYR